MKIVSRANRRKYGDSVLKKLFALSGNECAMPNCHVKLVYEEVDEIKGIMCHIEAAGEKGPRFNSSQNEYERNDSQNLIVLCPNCHRDIDTNPGKYTVEEIKKFKEQHELKFKDKPYNLPDQILKIFRLSINEDEFSLDILKFFLNVYFKLNTDHTKQKIYENRILYCFSNLTTKHIKNDTNLKIIINDILNRCYDLNDEMFIRCYLLLSTKVEINLLTNQIKDRFNNFLSKNHVSYELPRIFWIVHSQTTTSIKELIKNSSKYSQFIFNDILKGLELENIEYDDKLKLDEEIWQMLDQINDYDDDGYKNLSELERIIFNSFSKNE